MLKKLGKYKGAEYRFPEYINLNFNKEMKILTNYVTKHNEYI